jgi:hypothetical protein
MRLLLELLIVGVLIWAGWETPFRDRLPSPLSRVMAQATPTPTPPPVARPQLRPIVRSTPSSGSWMWDPGHRSVLDAPKKGESPHKP